MTNTQNIMMTSSNLTTSQQIFLKNFWLKIKNFHFLNLNFLKNPIENDLSEVDELRKQISNLEHSLQIAKENADTKDEEFKKLQGHILSYEDSATFIQQEKILPENIELTEQVGIFRRFMKAAGFF